MTPWKCPDCKTWIAPDVKEHRCDEPGAGVIPNAYPYVPMVPGVYGMAFCCGCSMWYFGLHVCYRSPLVTWSGVQTISNLPASSSSGTYVVKMDPSVPYTLTSGYIDAKC